jgi:hypothetical protein
MNQNEGNQMGDTEQNNMLSAEKIFKSQINNARDYVSQEMELGFIQDPLTRRAEFPTEDSLKLMEKHPFVLWVRQQPNFRNAINSMLNQKLSLAKKTKVEIINTYMEKLGLESLCAIQLVCFTDKKKTLPHIPVRAEEKRAVLTAMKKLNAMLNSGSLYFSNGAKQLLLHDLLKDLMQDSKHNSFSSRKTHSNLLRQAFIKFLLAGLFRAYKEISLEIAVTVALDVSSIFFSQSMEKKDVITEARIIRITVHNENKFLKKTVQEILSGYALHL